MQRDDDDPVTSPGTLAEPAPPVVAPAERTMLVSLSGHNAGEVFPLEREATVLGRGREADVQADEAGVSRKHARIVRARGAFALEDLGSRNGTFKNGERIVRAPLENGDRIHLGPGAALRFQVADEAELVLAKQLYENSTYDALTRAYNRRYFMQRLAAEVAFARRHRSFVSVMLMDLDHFKRVNDTWGHRAGDDALRTISMAVQATIRAEDVFARYGGEEFAVLARGIDHDGARAFAERLRKTIAGIDVVVPGHTFRLTVSMGVASLTDRGSADDLLALADERLYRAKAEGRNRVCA